MADEINRASPRTQSALLQAMQEHHVTVAGVRHDLSRPFHVLATQNPIEQEGTYPLPEAQLDRFMFNIKVDYPTLEDERLIVSMSTRSEKPDLSKVLSAERILAWQNHPEIARWMDYDQTFTLEDIRASEALARGLENLDTIETILLGAHVDAAMSYTAFAINNKGKVRALAVAMDKRHPLLPDVPSLAESGLKDFEAVAWFGMLAPAGTSRDIVNRLNAEALKVLQIPEIRQRLIDSGSEIIGNSPEAADRFLKSEGERWGAGAWASTLRETSATESAMAVLQRDADTVRARRQAMNPWKRAGNARTHQHAVRPHQ